jgi:MtN3 and saliva related transmembrane protein
MSVEVIGYLAAAFTTLSFVPQAIKTIRSRDTAAISLAMYLSFTTGLVLWLTYGMAVGSWPIILANALALPLAATILAFKLRHG